MSHEKSTFDARREIAALESTWSADPRWNGIQRNYSAADVVHLRPSAP